jgi:hypothetical protein
MITILYLILELAIIGFVVWLITTYVPMPPIIKTIIYFIVAIVVIFWLLGVLSGGSLGTSSSLRL